MAMGLVFRLVGFIEVTVGAARSLRIPLSYLTTPTRTLCITLILVPLRLGHFETSDWR